MTFIELTGVLLIWFSDGSYTVSTHKLHECYEIADAINGEPNSDPRAVDQLHFPDDYTTANSAMCVDTTLGYD